MPGSTMIGGHLAMAAGVALANQTDGASNVSVAFFGDGTLGSGDLHETMHIAGAWKLALILVCENNGWEMATPWPKVRQQRSLIPYAEPFGLASRQVDGNDAMEVYQAARWARATGGWRCTVVNVSRCSPKPPRSSRLRARCTRRCSRASPSAARAS